MFELFVARRYLVPKRGKGFLSVITWISVGGVFLGVLALVVVLAVMNGFENEVKSRIVGTNAHVFLLTYGPSGMKDYPRLLGICRTNPDVEAASPFVYGKALISSRLSSDGVAVKGISLQSESTVTEILEYVEHPGGVLTLDAAEDGRPGIILGAHIAENLGVNVGQSIQLLSPRASKQSPFGYVPKVRNFRVVGIFRSGMYEYDSSFCYIAMDEAQSFFAMGEQVTGIEIKVYDMYRAPEIAEDLLATLGGFPYRANDWIEMNANLFAWMQTEKKVMFVILILIVMIAAFNITGALIMLVREKRRDIGILRSIGATAHEIWTIFVLEGAVIGTIGMTLGAVGGLALCHVLDRYEIIKLPGDVYFIDTLPIDVQPLDVVVVLAAVLAISIIATLYPAWKASRLDPVEAIRYEN